MAEGEWHPFRGPADFVIPDSPEEFYQSVLISTGTATMGYLAYRYRVAETMGRMAQHHYLNPSLRAIQAQARKQTLKMGVWRGLGLTVAAAPVVGWTVLALGIAYSIPPSGRPQGNIMPGDVRYPQFH